MAGLKWSISMRGASGSTRKDPYLGYNFTVEIGNLIVGGFTDVTGLGIQVEVEPKRFGGENEIEYKFFKNVKYNDLVLKRGLGDADALWDWYQAVLQGEIQLKDGSIHLLDRDGNQVRGWHFFGAYPIKWDGPSFSATSNAVAWESITLTYHRLTGE